MKKLISVLVLFLLIFQGTEAQDLISAKTLTGIMKDKNVKIVSVRKVSDYAKVHIDGAVNVEVKKLYKPGAVKYVLKSSNEISAIMGSRGISNTNKIVIYGTGSGKSSGRLYWILKYMGCKDVKILNGHLKAWRTVRGKVTKIKPKITPAKFTAVPVASYYASTAYVKKNLKNPKIILVDNRSSNEFKGVTGETAKKGHISGAVHFDYAKVMNLPAQTLKSKAELVKMFNAAGITKNKEIILYCESSVRSGIVFLALKSVLGYPKVRVYDGAIYEWTAKGNSLVK